MNERSLRVNLIKRSVKTRFALPPPWTRPPSVCGHGCVTDRRVPGMFAVSARGRPGATLGKTPVERTFARGNTIDVPALNDTIAVNVTGTFNLCRAFVPGMRERGWGRIVNFASMAGKDGNPDLSAYSASKAAVIALTKSLGKELATSGILVNAVAPAVIQTPMNADTSPAVLEHLTSLIPMRRLGRAEEVAELVAWLASDRCSFSTGAVYDISGGRATY
jgi:NAD(P)-dependent dehydrogenase (short-subunit alcohol dehydrogenase family)